MIVILLPAYNEESSLPVLMPKIAELIDGSDEPFKIIVCNDGSSDGTASILHEYKKSLPLEVITHKVNRGLGETSRDLFERAAAVTKQGDVIVRLDCDDTHEPLFIPRLVDKVRSGFDVVIASRFEPGGGQMGVSAYRAAISRAANLFMKVFFPIKGLKEYSCGFRGYNAAKLIEAIDFYGNDFIQLKGLGFTCTLEKLIKLKIIGASFAEVPFMLRYDQKQSESKMVSSITTYGYLSMAILYHWPWGGWRRGYKRVYGEWNANS